MADISYIATREGWLYLAVVMNLYSRQIVGWSMDERMTQAFALRALLMACNIGGRRRLIHHSDHGSQYYAQGYQQLLAKYDIGSSMSRRGDCYDNAAMERFFHSLKTELVFHERYETREQAKHSLFEYIEVFYNRRQRHSAIGYRLPVDFEAQLQSKVA